MKRYWVSWWSGNYADEGCTKPPFTPFVSGSRDRAGDGDEESFCALIDAPSPVPIWALVAKHYPDAEVRFCEERELGWLPGDRFPGAEAYALPTPPLGDDDGD